LAVNVPPKPLAVECSVQHTDRGATKLRQLFRQTFEEYVRETRNTMALLLSLPGDRPEDLKALSEQSEVEHVAFEKYRQARRDYIAFIRDSSE